MEDTRKKTKKALSRRDFLKDVGGGAVGVAVVPALLAQDIAELSTKKGKIPLYSRKNITLTINGSSYSVVVEPRDTLLQVLREKLHLTGTKRICDRGECGGCTVLLDGAPIYSCMYLAIKADGKQVTTIEGIASAGKLHPVQQAFIDKDGYQCGFCTPGFIMTSVAFLDKNPDPTDDEIKRALSGNLCRCGNYSKIFAAVSNAAKNMRRA